MENGCPACSAKKATDLACGVVECVECGAVYTTHHIPLGRTYSFVLPYLDDGNCPAEEWKYFDFDFLSSKGLGRRHGWMNPATKLITQIG